MEKEEKKGLWSVQISVFLFGVVGLFAKWINQPSVIIVLGRVIFSALFLLAFLLIRRQKIRLKRRSDYFWMIGAGVILAVHWTSYMQAIQSSTVAIGTLTFSTFPLFAVFLEPLVFREKVKFSDVTGAIVMLLGVLVMVPEFEVGNSVTQGILWGLLSAFTYAILGMMNRRFTQDYSAVQVSLYEQAVAAVVLFPTYFILRPELTVRDVGVIMMLGVIFTAVAHSLFINGLRTVKVRTAAIMSGLESVYGILAAMLFLGEFPGPRDIVGGAIILGAVFYSTLKSK